MKSIKAFLLTTVLTLLLSTNSWALTAQQYCESLPSGAASYELLNVEYPSESVVTVPWGNNLVNGTGGSSGAVVFSVSIKISKFCQNGSFQYKKETTTKGISCVGNGGTNGCPAIGTACEGTGCNCTATNITYTSCSN